MTGGRIAGSCHCGAVTLDVPPAEYVNECNCTLCVKLGGIWAYYPPDQVRIAGATVGYVRRDTATPAILTHHCPVCGATTHWQPIGDAPRDRMGVNARLFEDGALDGVEVRRIDLRHVPV